MLLVDVFFVQDFFFQLLFYLGSLFFFFTVKAPVGFLFELGNVSQASS